jgi:hypothetical protein
MRIMGGEHTTARGPQRAVARLLPRLDRDHAALQEAPVGRRVTLSEREADIWELMLNVRR